MSERIAIVGASSLLGKELAESLQDGPFAAAQVALLDDGEDAGKLEEIGDEVTFLQKVDAVAFVDVDVAFFASNKGSIAEEFALARSAGVSVVDLTYALESEAGALVRSPLVQTGDPEQPGLETNVVISAHPAAVMLALAGTQLQKAFPLKALAATVLQPASEGGRAGLDELHQQTVNLLSFQSLPKDQFDAQSAFNLVATLGPDARVVLADVTARIRKHYRLITRGRLAEPALQVVQAPVFHGFTVSLLVDLDAPATQQDIESALASEEIDVMLDDEDPPSNIAAAGQGDILARVAAEGPTRFWIWMAADNLRLAAANAVACGAELKRLRPTGPVQ